MNSSYYNHPSPPPSTGSFGFAYSPQTQQSYPRPSAPYESQSESNFANVHSAYAPAPIPAYTPQAPPYTPPQAPSTSNGDLIDLLDTPVSKPAQTGYQTPPNGQSKVSIDLLDTHGPARTNGVPLQGSVPITPPPTTITTVEVVEEESSVPADLVASQQQILNEIQRRHSQSQSDRVIALSLSSPDDRYQQAIYDETRIVPRQLDQSVPISYNPAGSDAVHPKKKSMKKARPVKTAVGTVSGAVVGGLIMAPVAPLGVLLGGVAGGVATRQACKAGERRAQRKWEQNSHQFGADSSTVAAHRQVEGTGLV